MLSRLWDGVMKTKMIVPESPGDHIKLSSSIKVNSVSLEGPATIEITEFMGGFFGGKTACMELSAVTVARSQ